MTAEARRDRISIEAEQAVLGSILMDNSSFGALSSIIEPWHFSESIHQHIYLECVRLISAGQRADIFTLRECLPDSIRVGPLTITQYLARLAANSVGSISARDYARLVRDLAIARGIIAVADDLIDSKEQAINIDVALERAFAQIDALRVPINDQSSRGTIGKLIEGFGRETADGVVSCGFSDLDADFAGGYRAGRLYVVAGRPGMGKTAFALSSARRVARAGGGVSIYSLEIDRSEIIARLVADESARGSIPIPYRDVLSALRRDDTARASQIRSILHDRLSKLPIHIDDAGGLSITDIEARARLDRDRFARDGQALNIVMIDYLGLIRVSDRYRGNKVSELGEIALSAKTMAKRLGVAVVLLAQLNRAVEGREDKRPTMADLRASGEIEEHADVVALLYRPAYYLSGDPIAAHDERHKMEILIGKNRLGPTRSHTLWCDVALNAVDNWRSY